MNNYKCQINDQLPIANEKKLDIQERSIRFAVRAARFTDALPRKQASIEYGKQLIRASGSIGANLQEADGALSRKDFLNKLGIARREAKEANYWLILIKEVVAITSTEITLELDDLLNESKELKLILSKIIINTRGNS